MAKKIWENKFISVVILVLRLYLGIWFIHHVFAQSMYLPSSWGKIGSAMHYLGINFLPQFWGFMAVFVYIVGGLLLISGLYFRLAAFGMAFVLLVAANMHFSVGQGIAGAKGALIYLTGFIILLITGPGKYTLSKYLKK